MKGARPALASVGAGRTTQAGWCNGSTWVSYAYNGGSNPPPAILKERGKL